MLSLTCCVCGFFFYYYLVTIALPVIWLVIAIFGRQAEAATISADGLTDWQYAPRCDATDTDRAVRHPIDSQSYWLCSNGSSTLNRCSGREQFVVGSASCELPLRSISSRGAPVSDVVDTFPCPPRGIHRYVLDGSCSQYNYCLSGTHSIQSCSSELHFDEVLLGCNFKDKANCDRDWCPPEDSRDTIVTRPSDSSCEE